MEFDLPIIVKMRCLVLTFLWMSWLDLIFEHSLSCCFQLHRLEILLYILYAHHSHMVTVYSSERAWCHTSNSSRSLKMIYCHLKLSAGTVWVLILACPICDLKNVKSNHGFWLCRYQEYKSEYISTQKRVFFEAHKDEEWYFSSLS
jgi:hypothetical protein